MESGGRKILTCMMPGISTFAVVVVFIVVAGVMVLIMLVAVVFLGECFCL